MYFKKDSRQNLLKIDDIYASLKKIHSNGMLEFEFKYSIKQSDAIKNETTKVDVVVFTRTVKKRPILGTSSIGKIDSKKLVENILGDFTAAKNALKQQENYVLFRRYSDISAFIDNQVVSEIISGKSVKDIPAFFKSKLKLVTAGELKQKNEIKPLLNVIDLKVNNVHQKLSSSIGENTKFLVHDLIFKSGIDPSTISTLPPKSLSSVQSYQGFAKSTLNLQTEESKLLRLHDHIVLHPELLNRIEKNSNDVEDSKLLESIVVEPNDDVTIPVIARFFPPSDNLNVFVKFNLLDPKTGATVDSVIKSLSIFEHIKLYNTPLTPPTVFSSYLGDSKASILIKQLDANADSVKVYKKILHTSKSKNEKYQLIATYPLTKDQTRQVQIDRPSHSANIYRCIPAKGNILSSTFTNVVIKPAKFYSLKTSSLTSLIIDDGILLEARNIPPNAVSVQFLKKNLSQLQKDFSTIRNHVLIDNTTRLSDYISMFFSDVKDGDVYEFRLKFFLKDGTTFVSGSDIIEFIYPEQGKVEISVSNISILENDIKFNISLNIFDNDIDQIKSLLERQGINVYFENDIQKQRDQLKNLLACSVHRINVTTGEREDFGVISDFKFSDFEMRKKTTVKPLIPGEQYRYIINAVTRSPETVFESFEKTAIDAITRKTYKFKPAKFLHPYTLKKGTLLNTGSKFKLGKSILEHGTIGSSYQLDLSFFNSQTTVLELNASKFDLDKNILTWRIQGNIDSIDHFIIMKQVHGMRTVLGHAHNVFSDGNCQWIHKFSKNDLGQLQYLIVPVLNDYSYGQISTSNLILIEDV
jgi:hypothetical protein